MMKTVLRSASLVTLLLSFGLSAAAQGHVKASEHAIVAQTVDGTTVTVDYSRPSARGRKLFGGVVKWGAVWTPGANWATTFDFSRDVTIAGEKVAAGKYSVWALPGESEWTILLHEDPELFHLRKPKPEECRYRLSVVPQTGAHVESLAYYFSDIEPDGTVLNLHWGETVVPLPIQVEPSFEIVELSEAESAPYLGRYDLKVFIGSPDPIELKLTVVGVEGQLRGYVGTQETYQFVPTETKNRFLMAELRGGRIVQIADAPADFSIGGDGRATGFDLRIEAAGVRLTGKRID